MFVKSHVILQMKLKHKIKINNFQNIKDNNKYNYNA